MPANTRNSQPRGQHDILDDYDTDQCTVLERHLNLIILYVRLA